MIFILGFVSTQILLTKKNKNDLVFIPMGEYEDTSIINGDTITKTIYVNSFWMSNEITNKEYREFIDYIKSHPEEKMFWIDTEKALNDHGDNWRDFINDYLVSVQNSELVKDIIDTAVWINYFKNSVMAKLYSHYFTDKALDNYPVVGVPYKNAVFYCIWRTNQVNKERESKGLEKVHDFRLPTEYEWKYAAQQPNTEKLVKESSLIKLSNNQKYNNEIKLYESYSGVVNDMGLTNMGDNVSEWIGNTNEAPLILGGSWDTDNDIYLRKIVDKNSTSPKIGFRVIRSYKKGEN